MRFRALRTFQLLVLLVWLGVQSLASAALVPSIEDGPAAAFSTQQSPVTSLSVLPVVAPVVTPAAPDLKGKETYAYTNQIASITSGGALDIFVENHTNITGALIGSQKGELMIDTGTLDWTHLDDVDKAQTKGGGFSVNLGTGKPSGSVSYQNKGHEKLGETLATVGGGTIRLRDVPSSSSGAVGQTTYFESTEEASNPGEDLIAYLTRPGQTGTHNSLLPAYGEPQGEELETVSNDFEQFFTEEGAIDPEKKDAFLAYLVDGEYKPSTDAEKAETGIKTTPEAHEEARQAARKEAEVTQQIAALFDGEGKLKEGQGEALIDLLSGDGVVSASSAGIGQTTGQLALAHLRETFEAGDGIVDSLDEVVEVAYAATGAENDPNDPLYGLNRNFNNLQSITKEEEWDIDLTIDIPNPGELKEKLEQIQNFMEAMSATVPANVAAMGPRAAELYQKMIANGMSKEEAAAATQTQEFAQAVAMADFAFKKKSLGIPLTDQEVFMLAMGETLLISSSGQTEVAVDCGSFAPSVRECRIAISELKRLLAGNEEDVDGITVRNYGDSLLNRGVAIGILWLD